MGGDALRYLSEPAETKEFYGLSLKQTLPENKLRIFPTNLRNLSYFTEGEIVKNRLAILPRSLPY